MFASASMRPRAALLVLALYSDYPAFGCCFRSCRGQSPVGVPFDRNDTEAAAARRTSAALAVEIGAISGDPWAEAAFTGARFMGTDRSTSVDRANSRQTARASANAEPAQRSPFNGAAWLFGGTSGKFAGWREPGWTLLEMSYFTGPSALDLAPRRLERAATSSALADNDPQAFVKSDIRAIGPL